MLWCRLHYVKMVTILMVNRVTVKFVCFPSTTKHHRSDVHGARVTMFREYMYKVMNFTKYWVDTYINYDHFSVFKTFMYTKLFPNVPICQTK